MARTAAEKQRRQQKIAIGGAVLLALVLVIQVPRTLKMIKGTAAPSPPAAVESTPMTPETSPAPRTAVAVTETEPVRASLPRGGDFARKDPFSARVPTAAPSEGRTTAGEPGFRLIAGSGSAPADANVRARTGNAFVVVLRSLPVRGGRATAMRAAADFRQRGITNAGVLVSTRYGSLRGGYYVVHAGRFATRLAALESLLAARRAGADNPYVRSLKG